MKGGNNLLPSTMLIKIIRELAFKSQDCGIFRAYLVRGFKYNFFFFLKVIQLFVLNTIFRQHVFRTCLAHVL